MKKYRNGNVYIGQFRATRRHGRGSIVYADRSLYVGLWRGGKRHGLGSLRHPDGTICCGRWTDGRFGKTISTGRTDFTCGTDWTSMGNNTGVYVGQLLSSKPHGMGIFTVGDFVKAGRWVDGQVQGEGIIINRDLLIICDLRLDHEAYGIQLCPDSRYEGDLLNRVPHGKGKLTMDDGTKMVGQWRFGHLCGKGRITYENGSVYIGDVAHSQPHGYGKITLPDGTYYQGSWVMSKQHGHGVSTYAGGDRYEGEWYEHERHGRGTWFYPDGTEDSGEWRRGILIATERL